MELEPNVLTLLAFFSCSALKQTVALQASNVSLEPGLTPFASISPPPKHITFHIYIKLVLVVTTFNKTADLAHTRIILF